MAKVLQSQIKVRSPMPEGVWGDVDLESKSKAFRQTLAEIKELQQTFKAERTALEAKLEAEMLTEYSVPPNHGIKFGYNFGKLSVACLPLRSVKKKTNRSSF